MFFCLKDMILQLYSLISSWVLCGMAIRDCFADVTNFTWDDFVDLRCALCVEKVVPRCKILLQGPTYVLLVLDGSYAGRL